MEKPLEYLHQYWDSAQELAKALLSNIEDLLWCYPTGYDCQSWRRWINKSSNRVLFDLDWYRNQQFVARQLCPCSFLFYDPWHLQALQVSLERLLNAARRPDCCVLQRSKSSCTSSTYRFLRSERLALEPLTPLSKHVLRSFAEVLKHRSVKAIILPRHYFITINFVYEFSLCFSFDNISNLKII